MTADPQLRHHFGHRLPLRTRTLISERIHNHPRRAILKLL